MFAAFSIETHENMLTIPVVSLSLLALDSNKTTRYAFDGYLRGMFRGQNYATSFGSISGEQILQSKSSSYVFLT